MYLPLKTQFYINLCSITNRFRIKSLQIMALTAILDLKIFTNFLNRFLDYQYVSVNFEMNFYALYSKLYAFFFQ